MIDMGGGKSAELHQDSGETERLGNPGRSHSKGARGVFGESCVGLLDPFGTAVDSHKDAVTAR